jgi:hypothetical protein
MVNPIGAVLGKKLFEKLVEKYGEKRVNFFIILVFVIIFVWAYFADKYEQNKKIKDFCYSLTTEIWAKRPLIYPDKYYSECVKMIKRAGGIDKFKEKLRQ